jgi:hypothetical protein
LSEEASLYDLKSREQETESGVEAGTRGGGRVVGGMTGTTEDSFSFFLLPGLVLSTPPRWGLVEWLIPLTVLNLDDVVAVADFDGFLGIMNGM